MSNMSRGLSIRLCPTLLRLIVRDTGCPSRSVTIEPKKRYELPSPVGPKYVGMPP